MTPNNSNTETDSNAMLTDDERETFQRVADQYDADTDVGKIARAVLRSDSDATVDSTTSTESNPDNSGTPRMTANQKSSTTQASRENHLAPSNTVKSTQPVTFQIPDRILEIVEERVAELDNPAPSEIHDILDEYLHIEPRYATQDGRAAVEVLVDE